jgi:hypothetical protein
MCGSFSQAEQLMKVKSWSLVVLALAGGTVTGAAPPQGVTVTVVNAHVQTAEPVQGVRVSLSYLDGSTRIADSRDVTNRQGEAWLQVSLEAQERGEMQIEVTGASDLVIFQPAEGLLSALPAKISIQMLPKGSPALKDPAQIEAMLYSYSRRVQKLEAAVAQAQQQPDFARALQEWAEITWGLHRDLRAGGLRGINCLEAWRKVTAQGSPRRCANFSRS